MASNTVTISGMVGADNTYFADSPVVITVNDLAFPQESPIRVCRVQVLYGTGNVIVGEFSAEVGTSMQISFDISSALRAIWNEYDFSDELAAAQDAKSQQSAQSHLRQFIPYKLKVLTEYIEPSDKTYTVTESPVYDGGRCVIGSRTEMERYTATNADVSVLEHSNKRNGDASTKPLSSPERVGKESITSWVDISPSGTKSIFYPSSVNSEEDDPGSRQSPYTGHAPVVVRDDVPYTDFLFVNRRGAVETCSARMLESLEISADCKVYSRKDLPSYKPSRSIISFASGGRRSWSMSSGYQTREWAEWWTMEFLMGRRHWMLYNGMYLPVAVSPAKKNAGIYDRSKQQMPSVEFTVTMGFEG